MDFRGKGVNIRRSLGEVREVAVVEWILSWPMWSDQRDATQAT